MSRLYPFTQSKQPTAVQYKRTCRGCLAPCFRTELPHRASRAHLHPICHSISLTTHGLIQRSHSRPWGVVAIGLSVICMAVYHCSQPPAALDDFGGRTNDPDAQPSKTNVDELCCGSGTMTRAVSAFTSRCFETSNCTAHKHALDEDEKASSVKSKLRGSARCTEAKCGNVR